MSDAHNLPQGSIYGVLFSPQDILLRRDLRRRRCWVASFCILFHGAFISFKIREVVHAIVCVYAGLKHPISHFHFLHGLWWQGGTSISMIYLRGSGSLVVRENGLHAARAGATSSDVHNWHNRAAKAAVRGRGPIGKADPSVHTAIRSLMLRFASSRMSSTMLVMLPCTC